MHKVSLTLVGEVVHIKPVTFLGDEMFKVYRKAVEGAIYSKAAKRNVATIDKVPGILQRLRDAEFAVDCGDNLVRKLAEHTAQLWNDVQAARERASLMDESMRKKINPRTGEPYYMFGFQHSGISWLARKHGALLADEQGLGKTLQAIAALPPNPAVLVVAPANVKGGWRREVRLWRQELRTRMLEGRGNFVWPTPGEVVITNYDILPEVHTPQCLADRKDKSILPKQHTKECLAAQKNIFIPAVADLAKQCKGCLTKAYVAKECGGCTELVKAGAPKDICLIADEAQYLKTPSAQRSIRFRGISNAVRMSGGRVWLLTGTPLDSNPKDLWSVLASALLAQEAFGDYKEFLKLFDGRPVNEYGGHEFGTPDAELVTAGLQRVMLRRMRGDVLDDLPPKMVTVRVVAIDDETIERCERFVNEQGGDIETVMARVESLTKERKVPGFADWARVREALATAKIPAMLEAVQELEEQNEPVVVFSAHRRPIDILGKRPGWRVITGDETAEEKTAAEEAFQRGELKGIAATIRSGGTGITLTHACRMIFVDRELTPGKNAQAEDRICRIGQDRPCLIEVLAADHPLDVRVADLLTRKQEIIDESVNAAREQPAGAA